MIRLTIPFDPSSLSSNKRLNPHARRKLEQRARMTAETIWRQAGRPRLAGLARYNLVVRRATAMDDDRLISGLTAVRDALFARRRIEQPGKPAWYEPGLITLDDDPRHLQLGRIVQQTGPHWRGREEVVFEIEEVSAAATA